jgi:hypothetical protein
LDPKYELTLIKFL